MFEQNYTPDIVSLDDVFEFGNGQLWVGFIVTKEAKDKWPETYADFEVGSLYIIYEFVAIFQANKIYDNGVGPYPPLIIDEGMNS